METIRVREISSKELREYMADAKEDRYQLVDVREPKEYKQAHIPGALLLPLKEVETGIIDLDLEKDLIFYCRSGRRSRIAANLVADMGVPARNIFNLEGGILSWQGKRLPEFPKLALFPPAMDISQMLLRAFELEKGTRNFYLACSKAFDHEALAREASTLAGMEVDHARIVYHCLKKNTPGIQDFETLFDKVEAEIMEGGLSVSGAIKRLEDMEGELYLNFCELALDIEFMAYDLYKNLVARAEDSEIVKTMSILAEQEKGHIRIIAMMIRKAPSF